MSTLRQGAGGVSIEEARALLPSADETLFQEVPEAAVVGIDFRDSAYGIGVILVESPERSLSVLQLPHSVGGVEISYGASRQSPLALQGAPPEAARQRPLACGLQVMNAGTFTRHGWTDSGSLGCFVVAGDLVAFISNAHVLAPGNAAAIGDQGDYVVQPGGGLSLPPIGRLAAFSKLVPSPHTSRPGDAQAYLNVVDAALSILNPDEPMTSGFLPERHLPKPSGPGPVPSGKVQLWKVGCSTGLTKGWAAMVEATAQVYIPHVGWCWFKDSIVIESEAAQPFADFGDSGSAVLDQANRCIGLLYSKTSDHCLASPIAAIQLALGCHVPISQ